MSQDSVAWGCFDVGFFVLMTCLARLHGWFRALRARFVALPRKMLKQPDTRNNWLGLHTGYETRYSVSESLCEVEKKSEKSHFCWTPHC